MNVPGREESRDRIGAVQAEVTEPRAIVDALVVLDHEHVPEVDARLSSEFLDLPMVRVPQRCGDKYIDAQAVAVKWA